MPRSLIASLSLWKPRSPQHIVWALDSSLPHSLCSNHTGLLLGTFSSQGLCIYWSLLQGWSFPKQPMVHSLTHDWLMNYHLLQEVCPDYPILNGPYQLLPAPLPLFWASLPTPTSILPTSHSHPSLPTSFPLTCCLHLLHHQEELLSVFSPLHSMRAGTLASFANHCIPSNLHTVRIQETHVALMAL